MRRREELLRAEAEGWEELDALLARLAPEQLERAGYNPEGWSAKDLMWHVAFWCADAERALGQMGRGTFDASAEPDGPAEIDPINESQLERSRTMPLEGIRAELHRARDGMLERFGELAEMMPEADQWFDESGPLHYAKHLHELRAWVATLGHGGYARREIPGVRPDPP